MNCINYVRKGYIPNLGTLGPLLHVEKFVWWWWWVVVVVVVAHEILLSALGLGVVSILDSRFSILFPGPRTQVPGPKSQVPVPVA